MQRGLLQTKHIDDRPVQDVVGLGEELIEAPALLLIRLQDVCQDWSQEALETPETLNPRQRMMTKRHSQLTHTHILSSYFDRLQETGISVLHSIFPFSHF